MHNKVTLHHPADTNFPQIPSQTSEIAILGENGASRLILYTTCSTRFRKNSLVSSTQAPDRFKGVAVNLLLVVLSIHRLCLCGPFKPISCLLSP